MFWSRSTPSVLSSRPIIHPRSLSPRSAPRKSSAINLALTIETPLATISSGKRSTSLHGVRPVSCTIRTIRPSPPTASEMETDSARAINTTLFKCIYDLPITSQVEHFINAKQSLFLEVPPKEDFNSDSDDDKL